MREGEDDVVVVDHYDSYTNNLAHLIAAVTGALPRVVQHDAVSAADVLAHRYVVLSPGPGSPHEPADFAVGAEVIAAADSGHPVAVLGVCLGMQGIVATLGGRVARHRPAHGEVARVDHDGAGIFAGVPQGFEAVRYHSLAAVELPDSLAATAWTVEPDGSRVLMGVRHRRARVEGVQFHPESILSRYGTHLITGFLERR